MRQLALRILLFLITFLAQLVNGQAAALKEYYTVKIMPEMAPELDGYIKEKIWDRVQWASDFIEVSPDENTPPTEQTKFKILFDKKYLYVALLALDSDPKTITNRLSRRDGFEGDRINVLIDSYHDLRTAFLFTVTAAGVRGDEIITNNGDEIDDSWNPIWSAKAQIIPQGWSAEMKIPLSQLRFGNASEQLWGLNIIRNLFKENELSSWNRIPVGSAGWVSQSGELRGLVGLEAQNQFELQPFLATQMETYKAEFGNPYKSGRESKLNAGLDTKIGVTNDLTLDLTINPDFGQVEADPAAIALDGFEIFNREQRPFFVENKNIFDYRFADNRNNLFFSRRIGRSPQIYTDPPAGAYTDRPTNTAILGAAKFSGKTKNGWSIGVLESITSKEYEEINDNGSISNALVEPFTNYFVGRVQKDMNKRNTFVGGIFTATNRSLSDLGSKLRQAAYTGGLDFRHQWNDRTYFFQSNIVLSHIKGSPESILETQENLTHLFNRVDATHLHVDPNRTSLTGTGGMVEIGKDGGQNLNYSLGFKWSSPELELNDLGFLRRADSKFQFLNLEYNTARPVSVFRNINLELKQFASYDFQGNYNRSQYQLRTSFRFLNNSRISSWVTHKPRIYDTSTLRGGPRWRFSQQNSRSFFYRSDERRRFYTKFGVIQSESKQNDISFLKFELDLNYQLMPALNLSLSSEFSKRPNKIQYITQKDFLNHRRYILGTIDQETLSTTLRINYSLNPNLSIQYYAQPFVSKGSYKDFKYVTNPTASRLKERYQIYEPSQIQFDGDNYYFDDDMDDQADYNIQNPDFSVVQFNSNLVLRWEYIPGSELFLVWSQAIRNNISTETELIDGFETGILDQQLQNIFLIKATYRFIM